MFRWKGFRKELENDYPVSGPTRISFSGVIYQMNADSKHCCQFVDSTSDYTYPTLCFNQLTMDSGKLTGS